MRELPLRITALPPQWALGPWRLTDLLCVHSVSLWGKANRPQPDAGGQPCASDHVVKGRSERPLPLHATGRTAASQGARREASRTRHPLARTVWAEPQQSPRWGRRGCRVSALIRIHFHMFLSPSLQDNCSSGARGVGGQEVCTPVYQLTKCLLQTKAHTTCWLTREPRDAGRLPSAQPDLSLLSCSLGTPLLERSSNNLAPTLPVLFPL